MIGDLIRLYETILDSFAKLIGRNRDKAKRQRAETRIRNFFNNPKYPKRRRSFSKIRAAVGTYEGRDAELRDLLDEMGANPYKGEGDDARWELPKQQDETKLAAAALGERSARFC